MTEQQVERLHQQDRENRATAVYLEGALRSLVQEVTALKDLARWVTVLTERVDTLAQRIATLEGIANRNYDEVALLQSQLAQHLGGPVPGEIKIKEE